MQITELSILGYERVVEALDPASGLHAFIAVHDTTLGPALGGLRAWKYTDREAALWDVLRLAKGMTYKSAVASTGLGGGKSVIMLPANGKTPELFRAMGRVIESMGGLYITAEDVGTSIADLEQVRLETRHVTGLSRDGGSSGNPSPYTSRGVFLGLKATLKARTGSDALAGRHIAIQGAGAVARHLIDFLVAEGAKITVCDVAKSALDLVRAVHPQVNIVSPESIFDVEADLLAPCALGGILDDNTIPRLRVKAIAGAANNQLKEPRHGAALVARGILYAPDYVINAGGIINVSCELLPEGYNESRSLTKIDRIPEALTEIFTIAERQGISPAVAADHLAESILRAKTCPAVPVGLTSAPEKGSQ